MSHKSGDSDFNGAGSSISQSVGSHGLSGDSSSHYTLDSYPDQEIYSGVLLSKSSTSGSVSSKQSLQVVEGMPETELNISAEGQQSTSYHLQGQLIEGSYFMNDFSFDSVFNEMCDTSSEDVHVAPRSMETFLSSRHKTILPTIRESYHQGDFVYASHSLMVTLKIPFPRKYPSSLVCDICIFSKTEPVLILTIISDKQQLSKSEYYNAQLAKEVITKTRKEIADFRVIHGVISKEQFSSKLIFQESIKEIKSDSSVGATGGSMLMSEVKFKDVVRVFLKMACMCHHVRILNETEGNPTVYFTQHIFLVLCELLEERRNIIIKASDMEITICILKEIISRFCSVVKSNIFVQCSQQHAPLMDSLKKLGENVKVVIEDDEGKSTDGTVESHLVLSTSWTDPARWDFTVAHDSPRVDTDMYEGISDKKHGGENELRKLARAKRIIAARILDESVGERVLTHGERERLENMLRFNLQQFESRTTTFLRGYLKDDMSLNNIEHLNSFMEDYLLQCFRQRYIQLTPGHETIQVGADRHVDSIRKLSPLLAGDLDLEASSLLDRLIQNDMMSEAGRQSIMARSTHHTRNKAFITYLCGNFTSESFKGQFLPLLSEDHHHLAKKLEDEMDRLTISSKRKELCMFCKMKDRVNIRRLADALYQMNAISESLQQDLSASALPNTVKWSELFKHVKSMETIMRALELKNEHLYKEFVMKRQSCMECTCDNSENSVIAGSEGGKAEDDVANLDDFSE